MNACGEEKCFYTCIYVENICKKTANKWTFLQLFQCEFHRWMFPVSVHLYRLNRLLSLIPSLSSSLINFNLITNHLKKVHLNIPFSDSFNSKRCTRQDFSIWIFSCENVTFQIALMAIWKQSSVQIIIILSNAFGSFYRLLWSEFTTINLFLRYGFVSVSNVDYRKVLISQCFSLVTFKNKIVEKGQMSNRDTWTNCL